MLLWGAIAVVAVAVGTVTAAAHLGAAIDGRGQQLPANPFTLVLQLTSGDTPWPNAATPALIGIVVVLAAIAAAAGVLFARRHGRRSRVDRAASRMGRGRELAPGQPQAGSGHRRAPGRRESRPA